MTQKEIWKPIFTFYKNCTFTGGCSMYNIRPGKYEVSNTGKIRNMWTKQEYAIDKQGRVTLDILDFEYYGKYGRCRFPITRLVYSTFVRPLNGGERVYMKENGFRDVDNLIVK